MNFVFPFYLHQRISLFLVIFLFSSITHAQQSETEKHTGYFSVRATMIIKIGDPYEKVRDSLMWREEKIIKNNYAGKRIKQILYQKYTDRVVVFFSKRESLQMDHATAVHEGLLVHDPVGEKIEVSKYIPEKPFEFYIDTPLYIGGINYINIWSIEDLTPKPLPGIKIKETEIKNRFAITASVPGTIQLHFEYSDTKKLAYVYNCKVKRLAKDDLLKLPEVSLGNIKSFTATPQFLKEQKEMIVSDGLSFAGATAYFTGTGFRDIHVADVDKTLTYAKPYIDLCQAGSTIVFDNVKVINSTGKLFDVGGFSVRIIDESYTADPSVNYYDSTSYPQFPGGDDAMEYYIRQQLNVTKKDNIPSGEQWVSFAIKVELDGAISTITDEDLSEMNKLQRKCYDILKNGPQWTPGQFKSKNEAMAAVCTFKVDINY